MEIKYDFENSIVKFIINGVSFEKSCINEDYTTEQLDDDTIFNNSGSGSALLNNTNYKIEKCNDDVYLVKDFYPKIFILYS